MPPWLIELLQQHNSKGLVDTLQTLVGKPSYVQIGNQGRGDKQLGGKFFGDESGKPFIGLTPFLLQNFGKPGNTRQGTASKLGEAVLPHEFGHMAVSGAGNLQLADKLLTAIPDAQESEDFAHLFQQSIQFLRPHKTDTSKLSSKQLKIIDILLDEPIYKDHPLKKQKDMTKLLASIADSLKKK